MNPLKKSLFALLALFLSTEYNMAQPRKLKSKHRRHGQQITRVPQSTHKEITEVFTTDDQKKIAQEVRMVNEQAKTPQDKQNINVTLQQEVIKETKEIKQELAQTQEDRPQYIGYHTAFEIIKSKKELSHMKRSSWTTSAIIKPFVQTYRLFLRVWDQKKYAALLEKERKALEHALNVQAHNNILLLRIALAHQITKEENIGTDMFKKDNFYTIATHAFEGGAVLAEDITLSSDLKMILASLSRLISDQFLFDKVSSNPAIVQSIWDMNQVIGEAQKLREGNRIKGNRSKWGYNIENYDYETIKKLCKEAAKTNGQVLHEKKSYAQYLKDWISQPKNLAKAGVVMAAIGGLYLYGPATPSWLKEYANNSISSMRAAINKGYNTTMSSMKNLWNRVRGNTELPNSRNARMDAQEQALETDEYFTDLGRADAQIHEKEQANATDFENYHQEYQEKLDATKKWPHSSAFESERSRDRKVRNEGKEYYYKQMPENDAETLRFADTHLDDMIIEGNPHNNTIRKQVFDELDKPYQDYYQRKIQAQHQEKQRVFDEEQAESLENAQLARERASQEARAEKQSMIQSEISESNTEPKDEINGNSQINRHLQIMARQ